MEKKYRVVGMTCSGCQKKISETLNAIAGLEAEVNLEDSSVIIKSKHPIELHELNSSLKEAGNYSLEDPERPAETHIIPPKDRVSPSSVY